MGQQRESNMAKQLMDMSDSEYLNHVIARNRQFNQQTQQELTKLQIEPINVYDTLDATHIQRQQAKAWRDMQWTKRYLEGEYPPHYPVPAIYLEIDQHRWTRFPQYLIDILRFRAYHYVSRLKAR